MPQGSPPEPQPESGRGGEGFPDESRFLGAHPAAVLEQLVSDDTLDLARRARNHLREEALFLDADELLWRTGAWLLATHQAARGQLETEEWLDDCLRAAVCDLLQEDQEADARGIPVRAEPRFTFFTRTLGIEPRHARRAAILINTSSASTRRTFSAAFLQRRSLEQFACAAGRPKDAVAQELRSALTALSQLSVVPLQDEDPCDA